MQQKVSPVVMVVAIVVVVAIACFFGFRALNPSQNGSTLKPEDYKSRMAQMQSKQNDNMKEAETHGKGQMGSQYQRYRQGEHQSGQ